MKIFVGNDIVDLKNEDICEKHLEKRFLKRVLSESETKVLESSVNKKEKLWSIWSGKEAAYKVLKKRFPDLIFSHSKFVISFAEDEKNGMAKFEDSLLSLRWNQSEDWVHCVAVEQFNEEYLDVLEYDIKELGKVSVSAQSLNEEELNSAYSPESIGVRNLTKSILEKHMLEGTKIIRRPLEKKFSPPELYLSEIPLKNWDVSMSHDGRFVSCAVSRRGTLLA